MSILIINPIGKTYQISRMKNDIILSSNVSDNREFFTSYKKLFQNEKLSMIYVLRGPGSFTSMRFAILAAKNLSILYECSIKSCAIMDCVAYKYKHYIEKGLQLIIDTGTAKFFVYDFQNKKSTLLKIEDIDFSKPTVTNVEGIIKNAEIFGYRLLVWPDILEYLIMVCESSDIDKDCKPYYSIQPDYLSSEDEI